jgi:outer membrane protein OmpA-like peptidoglycan-associated protein
MRLRRDVTAHGRRRAAGRVLGLLALGGLAGCGQRVTLDAPVQWWHDLEGGTIAQQRPPPPGIGLPYPKIGTVPARPVLPDLATRVGQTDRLAAQREQVERAATRTPLPPPGAATTQALAAQGVGATPGTPPAAPVPATPAAGAAGAVPPAASAGAAAVPRVPGGSGGAVASGAAPAAGAPDAQAGGPGVATPDAAFPTSAPAEPSVASATLAAASAPPPPVARPAKTPAGEPVAPVQRATPQELAVLQGSAPAAGTPLLVAGRTADVGVVLPPLAGEPPPPPSFELAAADGASPIAGQAVSPAPGQGATSRAAAGEPLSRIAPQEPLSRRGTPVRFQPGSATLLSDQAGVLRALAARRGAAPVAVTGYGDAGADTPDAQSDALSLGLRRAQAMSAVLGTYGVPAGSIRIGAEAFGRGGTVRLIH